jgi:hypothetical protein
LQNLAQLVLQSLLFPNGKEESRKERERKKNSGHRWLMPVNLVTEEAEIRRKDHDLKPAWRNS